MVATIVGIACVDMSAPSGPASISVLQLPSPSVVVGDSMRDSAGVAKPIRVIAFDGNGDTIGVSDVRLFVTDTLKVAHVTASNFLVGDRIGTIRLLGQIEDLQTPSVVIPVTYTPTKIISTTRSDTTLGVPFGFDSASTVGTRTISVRVSSANDSASQGMIVHFNVRRAPAPRNPSSPAVFLTEDGGVASTVDTTDASGSASRQLKVVAFFLGDTALVGGRKVDSAIVEVSARYKGAPIPGSPLMIPVPIRVVPP